MHYSSSYLGMYIGRIGMHGTEGELSIRRCDNGFDLPMRLWLTAWNNHPWYRDMEEHMKARISSENAQGILKDHIILQLQEDTE
jgi:hypothetical protein